MTKTSISLLLAFVLSLSFAACSDDDDDSGFDAKLLFGPVNRELVLEVDYQVGAEPYVTSAGGTSPWETLFIPNAKALFSRYDRTYTIPTTLEGMQALDDITDTEFSTDDIRAIETKHRDEHNADERRAFYVIFLNGYFKDDTGVLNDVMGVTIGTGGLTAIFKPVVQEASMAKDQFGKPVNIGPFVEQSTLVHEFGHAIGLVNRGIKPFSDHHDAEHGAHCKVEGCVMYYLNEGTHDLIDFIMKTDMMGGNAPPLFGQECLDDVYHAAD